MLLTNIRIEAPSDRPSPMQAMVTAMTLGLDAANAGWSLMAPYRLTLMMYRVNQAMTKALFMTRP